jgi:hypothetical protein
VRDARGGRRRRGWIVKEPARRHREGLLGHWAGFLHPEDRGGLAGPLGRQKRPSWC